MAAEKTKEQLEDESIKTSIDAFRDRMLALRAFAEAQLRHARENQQAVDARLSQEINESVAQWNAKSSQPVFRARAVNAYLDSAKELESLRAFPHEVMLAEAIFIFIFSGLDAYLGQLLRIMFTINPQLLNAMCETSDPDRGEAGSPPSRAVSLTEVLEFTKEEIISSAIDRVVDSLIRKSYIESFDKLATRFGAGTLKDFKNWPKFVECSQRRNVIAHCGGVVGSQYLANCKAEKANIDGIKINQKLDVNEQYLHEAIEIVTEAGLKVGQVLWRKLRDSSLTAADTHLGNLIFELLKREQWSLALQLGEFGLDCAKRKYNQPRSERSVKIILINHAQAAKWSGDNETALKIVSGADWSGSSLDFCLAIACLKDDWQKAADIMLQLGKVSELVSLTAYYNWPIFRGFRETPEFLARFKAIFGVEFADDAKEKGDGSIDPPQSKDGQDGEN